ncbi:hypothetical protein EDC48_107169 [Gibbsiella quercinecans]|nr:DUF4286 family protein [Gibbsiella quercinecans]TCT88982.1 hypothetical protein EDC48_107169 [Gibbsiella quercinecans]
MSELASSGVGVLAIWHDIDPEYEAEVIEWYNREHHFERVSTDGFRRSRRYVAVQGAPKYFIAYETESASVLSSQAYLERANAPSPWSQRSMPHFKNNHRTVCNVVWRTRGADGGFVATFRLEPLASFDQAAENKLFDYFQETVLNAAGILKAQLWRADADASAIKTGDKALRDHEDSHSALAIILSGIDLPSLQAAVAEYLNTEVWRNLGLDGERVAAGYYVLQAALEKEHVETYR